jgi:EmrB/QacA subfamily drug resistance transporter
VSAQTSATVPGVTSDVAPRRWLVLALLSVAQFMLILDITVVNIALPDIGVDLGLSRSALTWVVTAYTLLFGGLMIAGGRAADLFGPRRIVLVGLAVFTAASLTSGLAGQAGVLLGGRAAQGVGAALLSPAALSILTTTFRGRERNTALGVWAALGGTGAALGVLLGGILTSGPGWRWVFFVNVPVGVAVLVALPFVVPDRRPTGGRPRIDVLGALLVTAGTGGGIYGLINVGNHGWTAPSTLGPLAAALALYAVFALAERALAQPLMDIRILTRRPVSAGAFLMLIATGLLVAGFFLGSFYLQHQRGWSALSTGLAFLPVAAGTIVGAHTASRAVAHVGARAVASAGLPVVAAGAGVIAGWVSAPALIAGLTLSGIGLGATIVAAATTALADIDQAEAGLASGVVNTFHELGSAIGVATVSSLAAASLTGAGTAGFTRAFAFAAATALAAAFLAALVVPAGKPPAGIRPHAH